MVTIAGGIILALLLLPLVRAVLSGVAWLFWGCLFGFERAPH